MTIPNSGARTGKERILVVDDEQNARVALRTILTEEGYELAEAADGEEALALIPGFAPAVVLADVRMPRMDGITLLKRAREQGSDAVFVHDDRVRERRGGGRGDAGRRRELPREAARRERGAGGPREGPREAPAPARHGEPPRARARAVPVPQHRRRRARAAGGLRGREARRPDAGDRAHPGRVRHRQGAHRPGAPRGVAARGQAVHQGELRGAVRDAARVGAVRSREGRLHRRAGAQGGAVRAGRRRHALPRRDRRHLPDAPGQAAARPAAEGVRARRRDADDQGRRAARSRRPTGISPPR